MPVEPRSTGRFTAPFGKGGEAAKLSYFQPLSYRHVRADCEPWFAPMLITPGVSFGASRWPDACMHAAEFVADGGVPLLLAD